jgi:hypothetical protein
MSNQLQSEPTPQGVRSLPVLLPFRLPSNPLHRSDRDEPPSRPAPQPPPQFCDHAHIDAPTTNRSVPTQTFGVPTQISTNGASRIPSGAISSAQCISTMPHQQQPGSKAAYNHQGSFCKDPDCKFNQATEDRRPILPFPTARRSALYVEIPLPVTPSPSSSDSNFTHPHSPGKYSSPFRDIMKGTITGNWGHGEDPMALW